MNTLAYEDNYSEEGLDIDVGPCSHDEDGAMYYILEKNKIDFFDDNFGDGEEGDGLGNGMGRDDIFNESIFIETTNDRI